MPKPTKRAPKHTCRGKFLPQKVEYFLTWHLECISKEAFCQLSCQTKPRTKTQERHLQQRHNTANFAHKVCKTLRKTHAFPHTGACFCLELNCFVEQACFLPKICYVQHQKCQFRHHVVAKTSKKAMPIGQSHFFCLENFWLKGRCLLLAKHLSLRSTGCKLHCFSSHGVANLHCKFVDCKKKPLAEFRKGWD